MEGTVNKAAGLVFLLCRCGDRDFHVYLSPSMARRGNDVRSRTGASGYVYMFNR